MIIANASNSYPTFQPDPYIAHNKGSNTNVHKVYDFGDIISSNDSIVKTMNSYQIGRVNNYPSDETFPRYMETKLAKMAERCKAFVNLRC